VTAGGSTSYTVNVSPVNGFSSSVGLSVSGAPAGATATLNPTSVSSGSSTLSVTTSGSTPAGSSSLTITGTDGGLTHTASVQLNVNSGNPTPNGNPVLPPKWAFGILWGSYHTQTGVLSDMNMLRNGHYGGDLYWVDSSWLSSSYTGNPQNYVCFKFASDEFPDPATMIHTLRQNHFWFGVWEWPWMDQGCQFFSHGSSNHLFIDNSGGSVVNAGGWHGNKFTGAFDYTNPATVAWWGQLNQPLADMGLSFYKLDTGGGYPSGGVTDDGKNSQDEYKALYRKTAFDFGAITNGGRGFVLTHTQGATGSDQTPGMWTGDTTASFSGLQSEMHTASGLNNPTHGPFYCGDTGGYNNTPNDELYIRWLEYTTFTPCQEYFGAKTTSTGARFPWMFGTQAQQIALQYSQLRYKLLPFRYSNAIAQYEIKPGVQYAVHWNGSTQLINGNGASQILVQPITSGGASSATVSLPSGSNWINYWTGAVYTGGTSPSVPAPLAQVPVLIKAGSIIPMGPVMDWVDQVPPDPLTLDIYPAGSTNYTLYEDDGVTTAYMGGAFTTTTFSSDNTTGHEMVSIGAANGSYNGQLTARTYVLKINQQASSPAGVTRDGAAVTQLSSLAAFNAASDGWFFDASTHIVWVKFNLSTSSATSVTLQ
jgi:alpha-glucosidase (family GH31 glycosyl hydrolase)